MMIFALTIMVTRSCMGAGWDGALPGGMMSSSLSSVTASPPPMISFEEVFDADDDMPTYGNGAGTPVGVPGVMGGMLLIIGGPTAWWFEVVDAAFLPPYVVPIRAAPRAQREP